MNWAHQTMGKGGKRGVTAGHPHEYLTHVCLGEGLMELSGNVK